MKIERNVIKNGNSVNLLIPKLYADYLGIKAGDIVILEDNSSLFDPENPKEHQHKVTIYKKEG